MSKKLIELGGFDYIPAINTGNIPKDNIANAELYKKLLTEYETTGLCPVFLRKNYEFDYFWLRLNEGDVESKEKYEESVNWMLHTVNYNCFDVWLGRMLYNYKLDCCETQKDYEEYLEDLNSPKSDEYNHLFDHLRVKESFGLFDEVEVESEYAEKFINFDNLLIALLPIKNPWEALAWFPMGSFNWCPSPKCQIALAKELYEKYGARIMFIGMDSLIYYLENPLIGKGDIESAARTLIIADGDVFSDYEVATEIIAGSHVWRLWWD